ncbi:hypothetical protein [Rhodococcus globerulus]|uniref:Uncharacterized protein n=1 Tax=Rhodococcus globerulus TaxID=33008 RepID=A0ABU4C5N4_RHOGO|nr:hypothetical protein [Rhodococcus globerulus]MDV6271821.1 hypothetical protein [Rhodococcus globerulus]
MIAVIRFRVFAEDSRYADVPLDLGGGVECCNTPRSGVGIRGDQGCEEGDRVACRAMR